MVKSYGQKAVKPPQPLKFRIFSVYLFRSFKTEIRWNHLIPADYFCFLQLFCEVHFGFLNLTQILTHTGIFPDWTGL